VFRIGDFSRIARVSCRLLRYYDELGLLRPAIVNRETGYRSYSAAQLPRLNRILVLKELGLSLEQIGRIVDDNASAAELRISLLISIAAIFLQVQATARGTTFLSVAGHIAPLTQQIPKATLGPLIAIAHSPEFEPDTLDVELGYVLNGGLDAPARLADGTALEVRELPGAERMAACVRVGPPEQAHLITAKIGQFVEAQGCSFAGPSREVFLQPPRVDRMEDAVVEMQFPIGTPHR